MFISEARQIEKSIVSNSTQSTNKLMKKMLLPTLKNEDFQRTYTGISLAYNIYKVKVYFE